MIKYNITRRLRQNWKPPIPEDPILQRIQKLYKKCKSTQHWKINTQKYPQEST